MNENGSSVNCKIDRIETTNDCLSSRAGLTIITRYLGSIGIVKLLAQGFSFLKRSSKGTSLLSIFHQLICFFFDGTSFRLVRFDQLKEDSGVCGKYRNIAKGYAFFPCCEAVFQEHLYRAGMAFSQGAA